MHFYLVVKMITRSPTLLSTHDFQSLLGASGKAESARRVTTCSASKWAEVRRRPEEKKPGRECRAI